MWHLESSENLAGIDLGDADGIWGEACAEVQGGNSKSAEDCQKVMGDES